MQCRQSFVAAFLAAQALLGGRDAGAAPAPESPAERAAVGRTESSEPTVERSATTPKRELPDYDGRPPEPTTPGTVLIWVPRLVLSPAYVVSEFAIRRPLGWAIAGAERAGLPATLYDFFTFGPEHQAGFFPTAYLDFGFQPSVGLSFFWHDALVRRHDLHLHAATGGKDWLSGTFSDQLRFGAADANRFELDIVALRRPDFAFYGLGPDAREANRLRYGEDRFEARAELEHRFSPAAALGTRLFLRSVNFRPGGFGGDRRVLDAVARGMTPPPGYERGYTLAENGFQVRVDQRALTPLRSAGVFAAAHCYGAGDQRTNALFIDYGGTAGGFVDLNQRGRVVSLAMTTRLVDPVGGGTVPFTELATLGGLEPMRGFWAGRLADRSAVVAEFAYRWPVWIWLDGTLRAEVGNVFGAHLAGFAPERLRWSGTLGLESTGSGDGRFELLFGAGSEPFEAGGRVDSIRVAIGTTRGL